MGDRFWQIRRCHRQRRRAALLHAPHIFRLWHTPVYYHRIEGKIQLFITWKPALFEECPYLLSCMYSFRNYNKSPLLLPLLHSIYGHLLHEIQSQVYVIWISPPGLHRMGTDVLHRLDFRANYFTDISWFTLLMWGHKKNAEAKTT